MRHARFCRSAHLFSLAALYLHTETLKPGLGYSPRLQAKQGWLIIRGTLGWIAELQNHDAHRGDKPGFYGLDEQFNIPQRNV